MNDSQHDQPTASPSDDSRSTGGTTVRQAWAVALSDPQLLSDYLDTNPDWSAHLTEEDVLEADPGKRPDTGIVWIPQPPSSDSPADRRVGIAYLSESEAEELRSIPGISEVIDGTEKRRWLLLLDDPGEFRASVEGAASDLREEIVPSTDEDGLLSDLVVVDLDATGLAVILRSRGWMRLEPDAPVVLERDPEEEEP